MKPNQKKQYVWYVVLSYAQEKKRPMARTVDEELKKDRPPPTTHTHMHAEIHKHVYTHMQNAENTHAHADWEF